MSKTSRGKKICGYLKGIRRKIAEENDIKLDIPECTYEGECRGTCPRCEWEVQYLEKTLFERMKLGKIATISGLALGLTSCGHLGFPPFQTSGMVENPDTENVAPADSLPTHLKLEEDIKELEEVIDEGIVIYDSDDENKGVTPDSTKRADDVFVSVERMPEFPGGEDALTDFLQKNVNYPKTGADIVGNVFVQFIVEKDGSITNPKVIRDLGGGAGEEALRVVRMMPKWTPGEIRGQKVRVQYVLPVRFSVE